MKFEDIPEWVPEVVRVVAVGFGADNEYLRRFLNNPKMKEVWAYLLEQKIDENGIRIADPNRSSLSVHGLPPRKISLNEVACAILYHRMIKTTSRTIGGKIIVKSRSELKSASAHYKAVMDALPIISIPGEANFHQPLDRSLLEAMEKVCRYCEKTHNSIMQEDNPYALKNDYSDVRLKEQRSWTQGTAVEMRTLWGEYKYGTLAKIINVVFDLDKDIITAKKVEGWCIGLPSRYSY